jgi:hypothetical protein
MKYVLICLAFLIQSEEDWERKAKNYRKDKRDLVVWLKVEGGWDQADSERNRKYPYLAIYGDGTAIRNSGAKYYKGTLKEEDMVKLLKDLLKDGFLTVRPPDGLPQFQENRKETIGINADNQKNEIKIPSRLSDQISNRPNDERLQKIKKLRDYLANYWPPSSQECDPAKEYDGRDK